MNAKHYVSLEVAKMLKEINHDGLNYAMHIGNNGFICPSYVVGCNVYPCPTILEAMDWLEKRDVRIEIRINMVYGKECKFTYYFAIYQGYDFCPIFESDNYYEIMYHDRYECMNAAIKKGIELLKV